MRNFKSEKDVLFRYAVTFKNNEVNFVKPKCGDIWMCNLGNNDGSIQSGYRPVFVISNNKNNEHSPTINVFPMTTKMNKRKLPVHVEIYDYKKYGLEAPSTILVEQPLTINTNQLTKYVGKITDSKILNDICCAMGVQFPIITFTINCQDRKTLEINR